MAASLMCRLKGYGSFYLGWNGDSMRSSVWYDFIGSRKIRGETRGQGAELSASIQMDLSQIEVD